MPGRLKSFELHGYKTFASRTEFLFADGITAIVGPNGSGKSNIADAIRWVLGEQSFGLLRAKRTEDMIFAGSEARPRAGMASATIVFDNSDGWLPIDFSEVGITRRAYRDGDNEYLLNGQRVRLKDVSELLAQSGLAERTYTIIGQGLVDAALSLKAEERRRLFEEAAGIGLHRARREEALRRLDSTRRNLERVQDILVELQPRLRSLERQARRSLEYEQVRSDLKSLLKEWYGYHWHRAQADVIEAMEQARLQEATLEKSRSDQMKLDQQLAKVRGHSQTLRNQIGELNRKLSSAYSHKEELGRELAVSEERTRLLQKQNEGLSFELIRLNEEIGFYQEQYSEAVVEIESLREEIREARGNTSRVEGELTALRTQIEIAETELRVQQKGLSDALTRQAVKKSQLLEAQAVLALNQKNREDILTRIRLSENELESYQALLREILLKHKDEENQIILIQKQLLATHQEISKFTLRRNETLENLNNAQAKMTRLQTQLEVLRQAEDNLSGYAEGARFLLQALRASQITGGKGALSNYIDVPVEYENAISSVLGEYLGAIVVEDWSGVSDSFAILEKSSTRGVMLPLATIAPGKHWQINLDKIPVDKEAIIGIASELVNVRSELRPVVDLLLGQVIIVKDRIIAQQLLKMGNWPTFPTLRIVTLKGDIFYTNGPILSASSSQGLLSRPRVRSSLESDIVSAKKEIEELNEALQIVEGQLDVLHGAEKDQIEALDRAKAREIITQGEVQKIDLSIEKTQRTLAWQHEQIANIGANIERAQVDETRLLQELASLEIEIQSMQELVRQKSMQMREISLDEINANLAFWQTQTAVIERAIKDAEIKKQERQERLENTRRAIERQKTLSEDITTELALLVDSRQVASERLSGITAEIEELIALISPSEAELEQVDKTLSAWITKDTEVRQVLSIAEHSYAQARINLSRRQESLDSLRRRIEDDFGLVAFEYVDVVSGPKPLPLDGMVEELPKVDNLDPELDVNVQRQRALLRRMGPINPEAQAEYQQVKDRFEFLTEQVTDLHKAENDIQEVIAELDLLMEREFRKTFDAVAQEFRHIFTRLFGGGSARLVLTEPEFITDTGIDIEARLPGRREQGLSLLSGGERSLTATALVFALLRISPTPFCILDEVDAMLDEANVGRFRELLSELSEQTQFIIITHNRNTVQAASVIYGVTMGRDSSSQVISLRLDELTEAYGVKKN